MRAREMCSALLSFPLVSRDSRASSTLRLGAMWKQLERAPKHVLRVGEEATNSELVRDVEHAFQRADSYFRDRNNARRPTASSARASAATSRVRAASRSGASYRAAEVIQSCRGARDGDLDGDSSRLELPRRINDVKIRCVHDRSFQDRYVRLTYPCAICIGLTTNYVVVRGLKCHQRVVLVATGARVGGAECDRVVSPKLSSV